MINPRVIGASPLLALATAASSSASAQLPPHGPVLVEFTGGNQLAVELARVRLLGQVMTYTLDVDETGKPTKCEIGRKFRRKYVGIALCRPLLKYHTFQPARDTEGKAIAGQYIGTINFNSSVRTDGSRNSREQ